MKTTMATKAIFRYELRPNDLILKHKHFLPEDVCAPDASVFNGIQLVQMVHHIFNEDKDTLVKAVEKDCVQCQDPATTVIYWPEAIYGKPGENSKVRIHGTVYPVCDGGKWIQCIDPFRFHPFLGNGRKSPD